MVAEHARTKYSAIFVTFTALGKTCGPGLSSVFMSVPDFEMGPFNWRSYNAYSFIAMLLWVVGLILVIMFFQDIQKQIERQLTKVRAKSAMFRSAFIQLSNLNYREASKLRREVQNIQQYGISENFKNSGINFKASNVNQNAFEKVERDYIGHAVNVIFLFNIIAIKNQVRTKKREQKQCCKQSRLREEKFVNQI